jgi:hypothetical protein
MTEFQDSPILSQLLSDFIKRVETTLKGAVDREGVTLTRETLNSIRSGGITKGKGWISGHIYYNDLLRIKDMKVLNYSTIPPIKPLAEWVERVGVDNFAYIPGYRDGKAPPTEIEKIYRIASGIQYHLKATPNVRRGYRGIYNDPLRLFLIPQFYEDMRAAANVWAAQQFREAFGFETSISLPVENINAARIQSAWNASATKIARKYADK